MPCKPHPPSRAMLFCLALSLLVHLMCALPLDLLKPLQLGPPVLVSQPLVVDLQQVVAAMPAETSPGAAAAPLPVVSAPPATAGEQDAGLTEEPGTSGAESVVAFPTANQETVVSFQVPGEPIALHDQAPGVQGAQGSQGSQGSQGVQDGTGQGGQAQPHRSVEAQVPAHPALQRSAADFLVVQRETLSYTIRMLGIPVGTAKLEARREKGGLRISLRIRSNAALSRLYPVDDHIETRHLGDGSYILCRIRQREGTFTGDRGFTISFADQSLFWSDRLNNLSVREPLPNTEVLDILSGFYYLRHQQLEVGNTVLLELYDSNRYSPTAVSVLHRERLTLLGRGEFDTLVIHPRLRSDALFQKTREIRIWLTDDQNRVPVRVEALLPLGKVTADLVWGESQRDNGPAAPGGGERAGP